MEKDWDNRGCIFLVMFNHKQLVVGWFKHCTGSDGSEDVLIHCAASIDWLKVLNYVVLQERQDPSETSKGLSHTYVTKKNPIISEHDMGKICAPSIDHLPQVHVSAPLN